MIQKSLIQNFKADGAEGYTPFNKENDTTSKNGHFFRNSPNFYK